MRPTVPRQKEADSAFLRFCYHTRTGGLLLRTLTCPLLSETAGLFLDSAPSRILIDGYAKRNGIDRTLYEDRVYRDFNDFFTRKIRPELRPVAQAPEALVAPCDGKASVYPIREDATFEIKGFPFTLKQLVHNDKAAQIYAGGVCAVFRLGVEDYHRYIYFDDCKVGRECRISGKLHTVQPIALEARRVFSENSRSVTVLSTAHFGCVTQIEVGAMMVGRIVNHLHTGQTVRRGEEKGFFEFGGSTVVLLFQKDTVTLDQEFWDNTQADLETVVKCGEQIGIQAKAMEE